MKDFDALIFDIDGTLWNASPACAKGWNLGLEKLGLDRKVTPEQIEKVSGHPYEQCIDSLLPGLRAKIPELFNTLNQCETEAVTSEGGEFFNGVLEGIRQLAGMAFTHVAWGLGKPEGKPTTVNSFSESLGYLSLRQRQNKIS